MFGEQPITDGVREIKISQVIGLKWTFQNYLQVIGVKIDFDKNKIYYFNDDKLQGCISCLSKILEEGINRVLLIIFINSRQNISLYKFICWYNCRVK